MVLRKVDVEQELTEYLCQRNIEQYDLLGYYDDELIASLWKCNENEWHWTKRLYNLKTNEYLGKYYCEFNEIVSDFLKKVTEWLNDEIIYLRNMYDDLTDEDIPIEE